MNVDEIKALSKEQIPAVDGLKSKGIETDAGIAERRGFLRKIGYKLG